MRHADEAARLWGEVQQHAHGLDPADGAASSMIVAIVNKYSVAAVEEVISRLLAGRVAERVLASQLLIDCHCRPENVRSQLVEAIRREDDVPALIWLLSALVYYGDGSTVSELTSLASHQDARVRDQVATALSQSAIEDQDSEPLATLLQLAEDRDSEVRYSAAYEIGEWWQAGHHDELIRTSLEGWLADRDARLRRIASEALARPKEGE